MADRFPYDELRQLGFDPARLPSAQTPRPRPEGVMWSPPESMVDPTILVQAQATCVMLLAEIIFGDGLRLQTHHKAVAALAMLGVTNAPEKSDADDRA